MDNYLIKQLRENIASGEIKENLKKLLLLSKGSSLFDQIILINSRYNQVEADNRIGILGYSEYSIERARVTNSILSIVSEIEGSSELMSLLRQREKEVFYSEYIKITVDFSDFIENKKKNYKANQFINIDDFLNEIYFEINEFVPPGSFRKKWILKRQTENLKNLVTKDSNGYDWNFYAPFDYFQDRPDGLSDDEITRIINRVYPLGERLYRHNELEKIYALNDEIIKVNRI